MVPPRRMQADWGTNPCGEIILRPHQFCNLSVAVARPTDTPDTLAARVLEQEHRIYPLALARVASGAARVLR